MPANERFITVLKIHKGWADRFSIISVILVVGLMVAAAVLADMPKRTPRPVRA